MPEQNVPTLDDNVEIPAKGAAAGRRSPIWGLLEHMNVNQSFFTQVSVGNYLSEMNKTDKQFISRRAVETDGEGEEVEGFRVWRTE